MIGSFTEVKPLFYWVQHILPLVYDDSLSYMELLGKVTKTLNELVENNNLLPDYIMELIKEYISSGEIEKVLAEVLANYMLNVKFPPSGLKPATGDGSVDDTEAIQGCIDYAFNNGGMSVYFPSGSYLTQPLTLRNKATLFGQDRYTTCLVMKGGATTAMFTGDVDELTLSGLGFDGNMDIQVNNVNLFTISVNSAIISNCLLTDGYDLLNITVNNDLQLNNLLFRHAVENALVLNGTGIVQGENLIFKSVSTLVGKNFVVMGVSKSILEQVKCFGASPNGVLITGSNNVVKMWNEQSLTPYIDNGTNNSITVYTQSEVEKITGNKTAIIGGNVTETITGNKGVSAQDITETTRTRTENTTGNRNETTGGNVTETITGDREVTSQNYNETVRANKVTNANKSTENVTTEKDLNANVSRETLVTKTVNVSGVNTENSGSKSETITGLKEVTADSSKETITGNMTVNATNLTTVLSTKNTLNSKDNELKLTGNNTINAVNETVILTGNKNFSAKDLTETLTGNKSLTAINNTISLSGQQNVTVDGNDTERIKGTKTETVDNSSTETVVNAKTINAKDIVLNSTNSITYKKPLPLNDYFNYIPFKSTEGEYKVLTEGLKPLSDLTNFINVKSYGAKGDGSTDDTIAIQSAINATQLINGTLYFPKGTYMVSATLNITTGINVLGEGTGIGATGTGQVTKSVASNIEATTEFASGHIFSVVTTKRVTFNNLLFSYKGTWASGTLRTSGSAISIQGSEPAVLYLTNNGSEIRGCAFIGQYRCIEKNQCIFQKIYDNFFHLWAVDAIYIAASLTTEENLCGWIENNFFYGDYELLTNQNSAIHFQAGYIWIMGNYILGSKTGIIGEFIGFDAGSIMIKDNSIEQQINASLWLFNSGTVKANMVDIIGNNFAHQHYPASFNVHIYIQAGTTRWIEKLIIKNNCTNSTLTTSSSHFSIQDGKYVEIVGNVLDNHGNANSQPIFIGSNVDPLCVIKDNQYNNFVAKPTYSSKTIITERINGYPFASMPGNVSNGSTLLITDGKKTSETDSTLTGGGAGTLAYKINNGWKAMF